MRILSVVLLATCLGPAPAAPSEPANSARYRHPSLGFSLQLPTGWTPAETGIPLSARFDAPECPPGADPVTQCREFMLVFRGATPKDGETNETFFRGRMEQNRAAPQAWTILEEGWMTIAGERVPWARMDYGVAGSALPPRRLFSAFLVRGRRFYELRGEGAPESFSRFEPVFRETFASLLLHP